MNNYEFIIPNSIEKVSELLGEISEIGDNESIDIECINKISLVIDEIITNIISYGYKDKVEHFIKVNIVFEDPIRIIIEDDGIPFNPINASEPDIKLTPEKRTIGGLGIHLVKAMTDKMEYKYENNHNILTLYKSKEKECF